jgi:hypothetical protein
MRKNGLDGSERQTNGKGIPSGIRWHDPTRQNAKIRRIMRFSAANKER